MLDWSSRFDICCFLDSHSYRFVPHSFECLLGAGARDIVEANVPAENVAAEIAPDTNAGPGDILDQLHKFVGKHHGEWLFGHVGYGVSRLTEPEHRAYTGSAAHKKDLVGFPDIFFFVPEVLIELHEDHVRIGDFRGRQEEIWKEIMACPAVAESDGGDEIEKSEGTKKTEQGLPGIYANSINASFTRDEYLQTVRKLQEHIRRGDCYEINFCQEFYSHPATIDPLSVWNRLSQVSPNPFGAFYRIREKYLLCASPERYLKLEGDRLLSQPIKGTSPRIKTSNELDRASGDNLFNSPKDRSENVMVVDLVRNDLSKICLEGTVRVDELFGIYSFPQVHQMISTVSGELPPGTSLVDCLRASFPMGSMTGAPKNRVVELIHQYERSQRGLFSGAVGYIQPGGDFDLNVVIRSILYNEENNYLSYLVGSAITHYSDPQAEYEECLLKAAAILKALGLPE